jgi:hypothetical protein
MKKQQSTRMNRRQVAVTIGLLSLTPLLTVPVLTGCGGASQGVKAPMTGRATFSVVWPEPARLIPFAAKSIRVEMRRNGSAIASQLLVRPENGGPTSVTFTNLPVDTLTAHAAAYPEADGIGTAQAVGSVSVVVKAGENVSFTLTMDSTIDRLDLIPATSILNIGQQAQLTATALDATGAVVLTAPEKHQWVSSDNAVVSVSNVGLVTALAAGTATINFTELESGKSATATVTVSPPFPPLTSAPKEVGYLSWSQDLFDRQTIYVDGDSAGNAWVSRGLLWSGQSDLTLDEYCEDSPHSGVHCARVRFTPGSVGAWKGYAFLNGTLTADQRIPTPDFGTSPTAGIDVTGARKITFWARSKSPTPATVEFFAFGIGHPSAPYRDSAPKISLPPITLTSDWKEYTISIPTNLSLTRVIGPFGFVASQTRNPTAVEFDIDDISFNVDRKDKKGFLLSFETTTATPDRYLRNSAYVYDNACAAITFGIYSEHERMSRILDAMVYAVEHDRTFMHRIRNSYQPGQLVLAPGWEPFGKVGTPRLPGWYDTIQINWFEDEYNISALNTGVTAWAALALITGYDLTKKTEYLNTARLLADSIIMECWDTRGAGGFTAGYQGFDTNNKKQLYKSTEHNIDLVPLFHRLWVATGDARYELAKQHAIQFVDSVWVLEEKHFWTGTETDGVTPHKAEDGRTLIPTDTCAWSILAFGPKAGKPFVASLEYAYSHMRASTGGGFSFSTAYTDSSHYEITGQMAAALFLTRQKDRGEELIRAIESAQQPSGGVLATDMEPHRTGFFLSSGDPWVYYKRVSLCPTAWLAMARAARSGLSPYWIGVKEIPDVRQVSPGGAQFTVH